MFCSVLIVDYPVLVCLSSLNCDFLYSFNFVWKTTGKPEDDLKIEK